MTSASGTILVVDDEIGIRNTIAALLADEGYSVRTAPNGLVAINLLRAQSTRYALVLLDLMMPRMDGWQFRREQLADPNIAAIPVVVLSAHSVAHRRGVISDLPANAYLPKPFEFDALLEVVAQFVKHQT